MKRFGMMRRILSLFLGAVSFSSQGVYADKKRRDAGTKLTRTKLARRTNKGNRNKNYVLEAIGNAKNQGHDIKLKKLRNGKLKVTIRDKKGNTTTYIVGGLMILAVLSLLGIGYWKFHKSEEDKEEQGSGDQKGKEQKIENETELEDKEKRLKDLMAQYIGVVKSMPMGLDKYFGNTIELYTAEQYVTRFNEKINGLSNSEFEEVLKGFRNSAARNLKSKLNCNCYFVGLCDELQSSKNDLYGKPKVWDKISELSDIELFKSFMDVNLENETLSKEFSNELEQKLTEYCNLVGDLSGLNVVGKDKLGTINNAWAGVKNLKPRDLATNLHLLREKMQRIEEHNKSIVNIEPDFSKGGFVGKIGSELQSLEAVRTFLYRAGGSKFDNSIGNYQDFFQILFSYENMKKVKIDVKKCKELINIHLPLECGDFLFACGKNGLSSWTCTNDLVRLSYDELDGEREFYPSALAMAAYYRERIDDEADVGKLLQTFNDFLELSLSENLAKIGGK